MKRLSYLCRAKTNVAEVSRKTARLFRLCLQIQYDFNKSSTNMSTDSANEGKKCLVKSGKVI